MTSHDKRVFPLRPCLYICLCGLSLSPLSAQPPDSILTPGAVWPQIQAGCDSLSSRLERLPVKTGPDVSYKYILNLSHFRPRAATLLGQELRFILTPLPQRAFRANIGLKSEYASASHFLRGLSPVLDEASVVLEPRPWLSLSLGRIYFVLDRLGLLADNINDAFEGAKCDLGLWNQTLQISAVASRQSATNYPFRRFFVSVDDYYAARIAWDRDRLGLGATWLASGIASEKGYGGDLYLRIGNRELAAEYARYRPSQGSWFEEIVWRQAWVAGADLVNRPRLNVFLQAGDIERGFTPMASSLLYSSGGRHLFFDQNTRGLDLIATYRLRSAGLQEPGGGLSRGAKPDKDYTLKPMPLAEAEWVGLWDRSFGPHSQIFIARLSWPIRNDMNLLWEYSYRTIQPQGDRAGWRGHQLNLLYVLAF